jgi:His/Glu/Gln/Arg/opine family amino acid ABC transporter permease subunit
MSFDWNIFVDALTSHALRNGALITIGLALAAQAAAAVIGLGVALARTSGSRVLRGASTFYLWFFRATPLLLQLLFVWNALPQLFPTLKSGWFTPFLAALIALSLHEGAYMAEITRSGLSSVDPGQRLAAKALGMKPAHTFWKIIAPQAIRTMIPPTTNEFITLLKLTSLASVISLNELLTVTNQVVSVSFRFAELYAAAAVYYLVLVSVLMAVQSRLERKFAWTSRRRSTSSKSVPAAMPMPVVHDAR